MISLQIVGSLKSDKVYRKLTIAKKGDKLMDNDEFDLKVETRRQELRKLRKAFSGIQKGTARPETEPSQLA